MTTRDFFSRAYGLWTWHGDHVRVLTDTDRVATLNWTDLDLSANVGAKAQLAFLQVGLTATVIGGGVQSYIALRKKGTTPAEPIYVVLDSGQTVNVGYRQAIVIAMDNDKIIEYTINVGAGWTIDATIELLAEII